MTPRSILPCLLALAVIAPALGQQMAPPPRPATGNFPTVQLGQRIPKDTLFRMYRVALGQRAAGVDLDQLYSAHQLIEQYFATPSHELRRQIVSQIEALGIDTNILGRIVHIRMDWPELEPGAYYVNETIGPHDVHYFLGIPPGYDRTRPWPLVIKLPTAHAFITDPPPSADDVAEFYKTWINEELQAHPDAIVLMPLLNFATLYGPGYDGMNSVIQAMHHAFWRVHLDPQRIYMIGHSMAGHAVWNLSLHYATYFASVMPLAGTATEDYQRLRLVNLRNTLPVTWHDADDTVLKVNFTRQLVQAIRARKIDVIYEETRGMGHGPKPELVEKLYTTMRQRVRDLYPREVLLASNRPDTIFNRLDWVQIYQPTSIGKERRVLFDRGAGRMIIHEHAFSISAVRSENRIEARTDNVDTLRFYLNDQMVDFSKPVTIVVNNKPRFEGMLTPSVDEMLKDQVFLGRGWRYFSAIVDVDLAPPPAVAADRGNDSGDPPATQPTTAPRRGVIEIITPEGEVKTYQPRR